MKTTTLSRIIQTLIAIADYFHTTVDYLIGRTETDAPSAESLSDAEHALLCHYRQLSPRQRDSICEVIENYLA